MNPHHNNPLHHLDELVDPVMTNEAAQELVQRLDHAKTRLFKQTKEATTTKLKESLSHHEYEHVRKFSEAYAIPLNNTAAVQELLHALKEYIEHLPKIKITVAYSPTQAFMEEILDWLAAHAPAPLRLHITVDPTIIAGASIAAEGRFYDLSLRKKLDDYFTEKRRARKIPVAYTK